MVPGLWGVIAETDLDFDLDLSNNFHREKSASYIIESLDSPKAIFGRMSLDRFQNDKIFKDEKDIIIGLEGIIFNSNDLLSQTKSSDLFEMLSNSYRDNCNIFLDKLRGNFSGFIYLSDRNRLTIFTDQLASKAIYYYYDEVSKILIFASELKAVIDGIKQIGHDLHLNLDGAYCLLTFGYMLGNLTLVSEIKKLPAGNILIYEKGKICLQAYYKLSSTPYIAEDEDKIINELDRLFSEAIKLEYEKDLEYGYKHISTLSGGLDSRTNVAYAKKLNYTDINCFTFSESGYDDEKIARDISSDNHFDFIFYSLDNGDYLLTHIDDIISSNGGLIFYAGSAHLYACLRKLSFSDYGLVHSGQIGDLVMGPYLQNKSHQKFDSIMLRKMAYSSKLIKRLESFVENFDLNYENSEICAFYERCINGASNGYRMIEQFTEYSSPFLYLDFLDYAMKIPPSKRFKESIYIKWINKSTPEFSKYKWEKYGLAPKYSLRLMELNKNIQTFIKRLSRKSSQKGNSMNPFDYWWSSNEILRTGMETAFCDNLEVINNHPELKEDLVDLFTTGSVLEKTQAITLLRAIKILDIS